IQETRFLYDVFYQLKIIFRGQYVYYTFLLLLLILIAAHLIYCLRWAAMILFCYYHILWLAAHPTYDII
ncbi:MAG TPA: hypothetical protein V6C58_13055, partial [Allocoleopsis sp.]